MNGPGEVWEVFNVYTGVVVASYDNADDAWLDSLVRGPQYDCNVIGAGY